MLNFNHRERLSINELKEKIEDLKSFDNYKYSLATGQLIEGPEGNTSQYPLLNYRVEKQNNIIVISN